MATSVKGQVLIKNQWEALDCQTHQESIPCANSRAEGLFWLVPIIKGGVLIRYDRRRAINNTPPTADSVKTIRVKDANTGSIYFVAIANSGTEQLFNDACNACCDAVAPMATVTIPAILFEENGCFNTATSKYEYNYYATPLGAGEKYKVVGSLNGVALPTLDNSAAGYANLGAVVTAINGNGTWNANGGVASNPSGNRILYVTTTGVTGFIQVLNYVP